MKTLRQSLKSLAVCALVACGAVVSAQATWHHVGSQLQSDSGWAIKVNTSEAGPLTINNDCHVAHPEAPDYIESNGTETYLLDLSEPIDDGSYIVGTGAYSFRRNFPYLHKVVFPDTLKEIPGGAAILFGSQSYLKEITPSFPVSLTSYGNRVFDIGTNIKQDLFFLNDAFASLPQQGLNGWKGTNVYFGVGMNQFGNYLFQNRGNPTRFYFFGDYPTTYDGSFTSQQGCSNDGLLLCYPKGNASWEAFLADNARTPTASEITSTQKYFPDVTPTAIVTNGVWKSIGNKARVVAWDPWDEKEWFQVKGSVGAVGGGANLVTPEYGPQLRSMLADSVVCTAPTAKQTYQGFDYVLTGYVLEKYAGDGVWTKVASGAENTYTFANSTMAEGSYRLVWQWQIDARFRLDWHSDLIPEGGVTVTADPAPDAEGLYQMGAVVTLTAADGTEANWGAFGAWVGDVGNDVGWTDKRSITVTMDGHKSVYCEQVWALSGSTLIDGYHTIKVDVSDTSVSLKIDGATQTPVYPILDLRKPIAGGYVLTGLGGYATRSSTFSTMYLPDTLATVGGEQQWGSYSRVWPCVPDSVSSIGERAFQNAGNLKGTMRLMHENITALKSQIFFSASFSEYVFGPGLAEIAANVFQNQGTYYRTLKFYGGVPTFSSSSSNGADAQQLRFFVDPDLNASWKDFIANSCREATDAEKTSYATKFGTDTVPSYVTTNNFPNSTCWGNNQYVVLWKPYLDDQALVIEGEPRRSPAAVSPGYGGHYDYKVGEKVVCTAPPTTLDFDGAEVTCAGYRIDKANADGTWSEFSSGTATSVEFTQGEGQYRVVWLWRKDSVTLDIAMPTTAEASGIIKEIRYSPENTGSYAPDTVVTVTVVYGDDWQEGTTFGFWEGDVPAGHESDNPLVITLDESKKLKPYVKAQWRAVDGYATTRITDGYWTLKCSTAAESGKISISGDSIVTQGDTSILDLQKPVLDGRKITAVGDHAFRYADSRFKTFIFPNELESIVDGAATIFNGSVTTLLNTFPNSLASLPGGKSIGGVVHGFKTDGPIKLLNKNLTTFPSQFFYGQDGGHTYHLGVGFTRLSDYAFDGNGGSISVYFYGDTKVTVGGSWTRGVGPIRFVVPKTSADWKAWIAAGNVTPADASSTATYNSTFPNQEPGEKFIGVCKNVDGLNGVYLCTWPSPAAKQFKILLR